MSGLAEPTARAALDAISDGVAVVAADWTIRYVNPAGAALLGRSAPEVIGSNLWKVFPDGIGTPHRTALLSAAANPPGAEPVRWSAYYGPVRGWFNDAAWRVGDDVVVVFTRAEEAEAARQRLAVQLQEALVHGQILLTASEAFTAATTMTEIADAVANLVSDQPRSPAYADIALLEPDGRHLSRLRTHVIPPDVRERYQRVAIDADQPSAECVRTGRPVFVENLDQLAGRYPVMHAHWAAPDRQAIASVPVPGPDGPAGALVFVWAGEHPIDVTEQATITSIAGYAGQAVARLRALERQVAEVRTRYEDTRAAMVLMQRTLLPHALAVVPGLGIAAHYRAADSEHTAGGDWFDAIPVGHGRVALVVGDVVGHGAAAAAVMGQLRAVLADFLAEGADVAEALARLDRFVSRVPGARGATAWVGVLDPAHLTLSSASCGHPPPIVLTGAERCRALPVPVGGPLGLPGPAPQVTETPLVLGELLLCFSDGLVERPGRGLDEGVELLGEAAAAAWRRHGQRPMQAVLDRVCAAIVDAMTGSGQHDDATLLAVEVLGAPPEPLTVEIVSGDPVGPRRVQQELADWLGSVGAGEDDVVAVTLAVDEAVVNAVEHGYRDAPGTVVVEAVLSGDGRAAFTISDRGQWREPPSDPRHRGRGLALMRQCADNVELENLFPGTAVMFDRELRRAPVFGPTPPTPTGTGEAVHTELRVTPAELDGPAAVVAGPVDMTTADALRSRLRDIGRGGLLPLSVDLAGVTHLGSAGVALLYEIAEDMVHAGHTLRLLAPSGSPAWQVVRFSGLDEITELVDGRVPATEGAPEPVAAGD